MSLAETPGAEDNPFSLFLILILLLGATGYFDPKSALRAAVSHGVDGDDQENDRIRPLRRPLARQGCISTHRSRRNFLKKHPLSAICGMLQLPTQSKTLSQLRKVLARDVSKHPLLPPRHKMLQ